MIKNTDHFYFEKELSKLSSRAKNLLDDLKINDYFSFYEKVIKNQEVIEYRMIRNCGKKTASELIEFSQKIIATAQSENDFLVLKKLPIN